MPAIAVSAVNTGTDTLTATAHGLFTGDRCRVRNVGGALPTGLTATVDVFAVRVDANNVKLSDTNAHALAGTNIIDITGAGSGTTTIEYGLPFCIPRVAAVGSQIFHDDDNAAWQSLVALYGLLTGQAQSIWSGVALATPLDVAGLITALAGVTAAANQHVAVSGVGRFKHGIITIPFTLTTAGANAASGAVTPNTAGLAGVVLGAGAQIYFPLPAFAQHQRLVNVSVFFKSATDRTNCIAKDILVTSTADPAADTYTSLSASFANAGTAISRAVNINAQSTGSRTFWLRLDSSSSLTAIGGVLEVDAP